MIPSEIEDRIQAQIAAETCRKDRIQELNADIERLQFMRYATANENLAYGYRVRQQRLASEVKRLVAARTPETVARMGRERGLK